jgi:hypothetical protein
MILVNARGGTVPGATLAAQESFCGCQLAASWLPVDSTFVDLETDAN